jgi:nicotinamidase-related amidase
MLKTVPDFDLTGAVLLPVDMQTAFDEASWPKRWNRHVDTNGQAILEKWRVLKKMLIHVRHDSIVPKSTLNPSQPGNAFRPGFAPLQGEALVSKSVNSAFIGTDLDLRLKRLKAQSVIIFGISTDMCVSTTIRTGANMGWSMILVEDACDCFELPGPDRATIAAKTVHDVHVATLGFEFCKVITTKQLLSALEQ